MAPAAPAAPAAVHLLRPAAGCASVEVLQQRLAQRPAGADPGLWWISTRRVPRRLEHAWAGASVYWIIDGAIQVRAAIAGLRLVEEGGQTACVILLQPPLVRVRARPQRVFQGWRYLDPAEAPADLPPSEAAAGLPPRLAATLRQLGLL